MIKLTLVAAIAAAGIASPAFAYSVVEGQQSAIHHSNKVSLDRLYNDDSPANQCEQAREVGWPHASCIYD
jgi:hypothetical protein